MSANTLMVPMTATTSQPAISIHKGYLNCLSIGNLLPAINMMDKANGKINPFTKPANNNNSLGLPVITKMDVEIMIKQLIINLSFCK